MGKATLSQAQLDKFKYAMGWSAAGGNFRNAQPLKGRTIYGCTDLPQPVVMKPWYPYHADYWAAGSTNANQVCKHGTFQSPIDFEKCSVPSSREALGTTWPTQTVQLTNNGHTVQITAGNTGDARGKMIFGRKTYTLIQCHWHWGSEHRVSGLQLPLEVHCVHQLDGTSEAPSYGVFGVFYELSDKPNSFLSRFEDQLPSAPAHRRLDEAEEEEQVHGLNLFGHPIINGSEGRRLASSTTSSFTGPLDMRSLYGGVDTSKFWDYEGSFTTPPCTEAVDFYIMMGRAGMTMAQLNKFKAAIGWDTLTANGNFRPPQPLNGRAVSGCDSINLPQTPVVAAPVVDEESCPSQAPLITLQAITGVCVVVILLVVAIGASKTLMGASMAGKDQGNSLNQVYGKSGGEMSSGGSKQDVAATLAKLQEDLKALMSGNISVMQAKSEENGKLVSNTVQLAKEIKENMKGISASNTDAHPAAGSIDVDAHSPMLGRSEMS
jgi:carbonic anhydrase